MPGKKIYIYIVGIFKVLDCIKLKGLLFGIYKFVNNLTLNTNNYDNTSLILILITHL